MTFTSTNDIYVYQWHLHLPMTFTSTNHMYIHPYPSIHIHPSSIIHHPYTYTSKSYQHTPISYEIWHHQHKIIHHQIWKNTGKPYILHQRIFLLNIQGLITRTFITLSLLKKCFEIMSLIYMSCQLTSLSKSN